MASVDKCGPLVDSAGKFPADNRKLAKNGLAKGTCLPDFKA